MAILRVYINKSTKNKRTKVQPMEDVVEKIFMLIYRYRPADDKECKDGQIYFMMTSAEKDQMFRNVMERLRKDKEAQKI